MNERVLEALKQTTEEDQYYRARREQRGQVRNAESEQLLGHWWHRFRDNQRARAGVTNDRATGAERDGAPGADGPAPG